MKQITLNIKESKYKFFLELIKSLDFVQIQEEEGDSKEKIMENLKQGFKELEEYKQGKLSTTSAQDFLNGL
ncbi:MAG: hypothetical protein MRZ79_17815 [Bacteroidia bacterium]|nr:hypothetical protein [Bacteroidia bacterium]